MKKVVKTLALASTGALVMVCAGAQANAEPKFYAGIGYSHATLEAATALDASVDFELPMTTFQVGVQISPNLKIEGRYGINAGDYEHSASDSIAVYHETYEVASYWAALAKIGVPLNQSLSVYGMVGFNKLEVDYHGEAYIPSVAKTVRVSDTASDSGLTYGAGLEVNLSESFALNGEYQVMFDNVSSFNIGLNYRF